MLNEHKSYIFCESPPLKDKGFGFSVLLYHLTQSKQAQIATFFAFRFSKKITNKDLDQSNFPIKLLDSFVPDFIYKKIPNIFLGFFQEIVFYLNLPILINTLKKNPSYPITICVGATPHPVFYSYLLSMFIKNDIYIYIVDNFEILSSKKKWSIAYTFGKILFPKMINKYKKVFVISRGLENLYKNQYNTTCTIIYPKFSIIKDVLIDKKHDNTYFFVFSGGLSRLYNTPLIIFANVLLEMNKAQSKINFQLIIQTYSSLEYFNQFKFPSSVVHYNTSDVRSSNIDSYRKADCFLIPYSFDFKEKELVSTSFPQKIAELIQLKRPLLYFGPNYGSASIFFKENNLNYIVNTFEKEIIIEKINSILQNLDTNYLANYSKAYSKHFNPEV